jgi:hypothetical protein
MMRTIVLFLSIFMVGCAATAPIQPAVTAPAGLPEPVLTLKAFEQLVKGEQPEATLVIFDIDDTLLESRRFYGGDTWYNWQRGRPVMHESGSEIRIAEEDKVACIFSQLTLLYELGHYEPVEPDAVEIFNRVASQHDVLLLTSRSPAYRPGSRCRPTTHGASAAILYVNLPARCDCPEWRWRCCRGQVRGMGALPCQHASPGRHGARTRLGAGFGGSAA